MRSSPSLRGMDARRSASDVGEAHSAPAGESTDHLKLARRRHLEQGPRSPLQGPLDPRMGIPGRHQGPLQDLGPRKFMHSALLRGIGRRQH